MLDRIENTIHQLHAITGSLTHDIRSPLTAVRARLEMALTAGKDDQSESIVSAIEDMDRLNDFLNKSLDVAEAGANALRMNRVPVDLDELLRAMIDLYQPGMSDKGLHIELSSAGPLQIYADAALLHRMMANLFDNEAKHVPPSCTVEISLALAGEAAMLVIEDNGPGFDSEITAHLFERRIKGRNSNGHGLGLAFVEAVARAHGGTIEAANRVEGGARLVLVLPRSVNSANSRAPAMAFMKI
jgi:signal transduction histidine kinase